MNSPTDLLAPVGWVCTRSDAAAIVFKHEEWPSVVRAVKESEDLWRVEMTESAGEAENTRTVGYACTRNRALDALFSSMSTMNRVADRTGVVRTMMTATLSLYDDANARGITPEWRTASRPFERQVTPDAPREAWRRAGGAETHGDAGDSLAGGEGDENGADAGDGDGDGAAGDAGDATGAGGDADGHEAGSSDGESNEGD